MASGSLRLSRSDVDIFNSDSETAWSIKHGVAYLYELNCPVGTLIAYCRHLCPIRPGHLSIPATSCSEARFFLSPV